MILRISGWQGIEGRECLWLRRIFSPGFEAGPLAKQASIETTELLKLLNKGGGEGGEFKVKIFYVSLLNGQEIKSALNRDMQP